jgi:Raf kinase inhibitor-like YbhB/YbcL family protein
MKWLSGSCLLILFVVQAKALTLTSDKLSQNGMIPKQYTCTGADISPALNWQNIPENTQSLALVMQDPDASNGVWTHWIIFNIPPRALGLNEGALQPKGILYAQNSWGQAKYQGPCPPKGMMHHYVFTLYAINKTLDLSNGAGADDVLNAMTGYVLDSASLTGLYQK